jgi:hypothetical protein
MACPALSWLAPLLSVGILWRYANCCLLRLIWSSQCGSRHHTVAARACIDANDLLTPLPSVSPPYVTIGCDGAAVGNLNYRISLRGRLG